MQQDVDVLVVGGGPAGLAAALTGVQLDDWRRVAQGNLAGAAVNADLVAADAAATRKAA